MHKLLWTPGFGIIAAAFGLTCSDTDRVPSAPDPDDEEIVPKVYVPCRPQATIGVCSNGASPGDASDGAAGNGSSSYGLIDADERAAALVAKVHAYDKIHASLHTFTTGLNTEITITDDGARAAVELFVLDPAWDFAVATGLSPEDAVQGWAKVAGAYGGVGAAADAFRYGTLRDSGASCEAVEQARQQLQRALDALHLATAITGSPGVIARGFARTDVPGAGQAVETVPLFDAAGQPLPAEKNNGTWREDNSEGGQYASYVWEDSCSRDQYVGWVAGMAAAWEVIADDPAFDEATKQRLQQDALALAQSLMEVQESGYDLEIRDADGRRTFHGVMNENGIAEGYLEGAQNGFNGMMSLGIVAGLAYVAEDSDVFAYIEEELIADRRLHDLARDNMIGVDLGVGSNFSTYNMAFLGGWLSYRYLCNDDARAVIATAIAGSLYDRGGGRQPAEQKQSLYDFVYAVSTTGATALGPMRETPDPQAIEHGVDSLVGFADAPFWDYAIENCDADEVETGTCILNDGTEVELLGEKGWNDALVTSAPVPLALRPPSNYYWRSDPYTVNGGGDPSRLLPGVDLRFAYWLARWVR